MKRARIVSVAMLIAGASVITNTALAQQPATRRTELQRHDLSIRGRGVVRVGVAFDPGAVVPPHRHPGDETVYVLDGSIEYQIAGAPTKIYKAGAALVVPAGVVHSAKNVGSGNATELATHFVEKRKTTG